MESAILISRAASNERWSRQPRGTKAQARALAAREIRIACSSFTKNNNYCSQSIKNCIRRKVLPLLCHLQEVGPSCGSSDHSQMAVLFPVGTLQTKQTKNTEALGPSCSSSDHLQMAIPFLMRTQKEKKKHWSTFLKVLQFFASNFVDSVFYWFCDDSNKLWTSRKTPSWQHHWEWVHIQESGQVFLS